MEVVIIQFHEHDGVSCRGFGVLLSVIVSWYVVVPSLAASCDPRARWPELPSLP